MVGTLRFHRDTSPGIGRRGFLQAAVAAFAGAGPAHAAEIGPRFVSLDITATQIAVSAGANLIAATTASGFRAGRSDLALDASVIDIGHPAEPNLELLQSLRPDVLLSAWPLAEDAPVRRIAPVLALDLFDSVDDWLSRIERAAAWRLSFTHRSFLEIGSSIRSPSETEHRVALHARETKGG